MASAEKICQICLEHRERCHLIPIIAKNSNVALRIFLISGVQVIDSRKTPALICDQCVRDLHVADSIRKKCIDAEKHLKALVPSDFFKDFSVLKSETNVKVEAKALETPEDPPIEDDFHGSSLFSPSSPERSSDKEAEALDNSKNSTKSTKKPKKSYKKSKERVLLCSQCPKNFKWPYALREHEQTVHAVKDPNIVFECDHCGKKKSTYFQIKDHVRIHVKFHDFICTVCGAGCKSVSSLATHERTHGTANLKCNFCNKLLKNKQSLKSHIAAIHEKSLGGSCPHCPYVTNWRYNMDKHIRQVHLKEKRFKCAECDWKFYRLNSLKRHMRTHTGEKPFKCENQGCDRAFCDLKGKRNHMEKCSVPT